MRHFGRFFGPFLHIVQKQHFSLKARTIAIIILHLVLLDSDPQAKLTQGSALLQYNSNLTFSSSSTAELLECTSGQTNLAKKIPKMNFLGYPFFSA